MKTKICIVFFLILTAFLLMSTTKTKNKNEIVLKSYNNTVALYENGIKKEIYEQIVLNSLPPKDVEDLKKGIIISDEEELLRILEDFDG